MTTLTSDGTAVVHLRLPLDVRRALRAAAAIRGRTQADVVSELVLTEARHLGIPMGTEGSDGR